jgi:hypothetical protein
MQIHEEGESSKPKVIAQTSSLFLGPVPKDQGSDFSGPVLRDHGSVRDQGSVGSLLSSNSNFSVAIGLREFLKPQSQNLNDHHRNSKSIETSSIGNSPDIEHIEQRREKISQMENFYECASGSGTAKKQTSEQNRQFKDYLLNNTTSEPLPKKSKTDSDKYIFIKPEQNKCTICFVRFSNKEKLLRHFEVVHGRNSQ